VAARVRREGLARAGPWRERERERERCGAGKLGRGEAHAGRGGEKGAREGEGVGLLGSISFTSSLLFLFYTLSIQTIPIEFKILFEFKPTQIKPCTSMNAQAS
jgi:hypothetical protein